MDEKTLNNLSIFELRDLARKVGVFNPTVLKKKELISQICDIYAGKTNPHVSKTKQGRPPKEIGGYDKLVNIFLPSDITEVPTKEERLFSGDSGRLIFHSELSCEEGNLGQVTYKGYLEELENESGLLRPRTIRSQEQLEYVYVPNKTMKMYNLKAGDEVLCKANIVRSDRAMVLTEILEINGEKLDLYSTNRKDFATLACKLDGQPFSVVSDENKNTIEMCYGDSIFVYSEKESFFTAFIYKFAQTNNDKFDKIVYVCPMLTNQNYERLKSMPAEIYSSDFDARQSQQQKTTFLAYNRARRLAEGGNNVLFVVDNALALLGLERDLNDNMLITKTIISSAKLMDKGSLTVVVNVPPLNQKIGSTMYYSTFSVLENVGIVLKESNIDFLKSYRK